MQTFTLLAQIPGLGPASTGEDLFNDEDMPDDDVMGILNSPGRNKRARSHTPESMVYDTAEHCWRSRV